MTDVNEAHAEIARLRKREAAVREYLAECRELGIGAVCEDILAIMDEEGVGE